MKQISLRYCKLWQRATSNMVTDVSDEPAVPEVMAPTTLHGVTTQIFTAVPASNTKHEPTQNSPDNFHGKILYTQGCAD